MPSGFSPGGRPINETPLSASKSDNWVARAGGLPPYVRGIARGIAKKHGGKPTSRDIAIALAQVKKLTAKSKNPAVKVAAAGAVGQWEAARAKNKTKSLSHRSKRDIALAIAQQGAGGTTVQQANAAPVKQKKPATYGKNGKINNWGSWDQQQPQSQGTISQNGVSSAYNGPALKQSTVDAISAFQKANGLNATGALDANTVAFAQKYPQQVLAAKAAAKQATADKKAASAATTAANKQASATKKAAALKTATDKKSAAALLATQKQAAKATVNTIKVEIAKAKALKQNTAQLSTALAQAQANYSNLSNPGAADILLAKSKDIDMAGMANFGGKQAAPFGSKKGSGKKGAKKRAAFALTGGRFPLNTPGRVQAAPGLAARSVAAGNLSPALAARVKVMAAKKRKQMNLARAVELVHTIDLSKDSSK